MATRTDLVKVAGGDVEAAGAAEETLTQQLERLLLPAVEKALGRRDMADRMIRIGLTEIRKTPKLATCTPASLFGSIIHSAQLNLPPGSPLGLSWMIPMENYSPAAGRKVMECEWWLGYPGMVELARRSGRIGQLHADVVRRGDEFGTSLGSNGGLHHRADHLVPSADRGPIVAAYCYWRYPDGGDDWMVKSIQDVYDDHRAASRAWLWAETGDTGKGGGRRDSPWHVRESQMVRKSMVRAAFPMLPVSDPMTDAVAADERVVRWDPEQGGSPVIDVDAQALLAAVPTPDDDTDDQD